MTFIDRVIKYIRPNFKILDLGAGQGEQARLFAKVKSGVQVVAVDLKEPPKLFNNINWITQDVREYLAETDEKFDLIVLKNILQFLPKEYVLNQLPDVLKNHLKPDSIIAIQTFLKNPEPSFKKPAESLYFLEELREKFKDMSVIHEDQLTTDGKDMEGQMRKFYLTEIIVKNEKN